MITNLAVIVAPSLIAFLIGILITPHLTDFLYRNKYWKKVSVGKTIDGREATISNKIHNDEERKTPRMGGLVVWVSVLLTTLVFWLMPALIDNHQLGKANFLSRNQTWLPLFSLIVMSLVGIVDDYLVIKGRGKYIGGGLSLRTRLVFVLGIATLGAFWFFFKLGFGDISIPLVGVFHMGMWFIPFFIFVVLATYSGGIIDGVDGLAGGIFAVIFSSYAIIAFAHNQIDLAAFCMVIVGGLLAFLWFNIPPARFFLSETGTMGLTVTLAVVAFLTGGIAVLPLVAFPLVITTGSSVIQILSKRFRNGKKVFIVAPLHNHFQAKGWPPYKVVMRYWVISVFFASAGIILALIG